MSSCVYLFFKVLIIILSTKSKQITFVEHIYNTLIDISLNEFLLRKKFLIP